MAEWDRFVIRDAGLEWERYLANWAWLLKEPYRPLAMTVFGDWFLQNAAGRIFFLDLVSGELQPAAESAAEMQRALADPEQTEGWFMPGLVDLLTDRGLTRGAGQCYAYTLHPLLGGAIEANNVTLMPIGAWQAVCAQLHQQTQGVR